MTQDDKVHPVAGETPAAAGEDAPRLRAPELVEALAQMVDTAMRLGFTRGDLDDNKWCDALSAHFDAIKRAKALLATYSAGEAEAAVPAPPLEQEK